MIQLLWLYIIKHIKYCDWGKLELMSKAISYAQFTLEWVYSINRFLMKLLRKN